MHSHPPRKGELWLVNIPDGEGHEQKGQRPALIAGEEPSLGMRVIIPLTSNISAERFPHTHKLTASNQNGLNADSIALVFQIRAIDDSRLIHKLGSLETKEQQAIESLTKDLLKL